MQCMQIALPFSMNSGSIKFSLTTKFPESRGISLSATFGMFRVIRSNVELFRELSNVSFVNGFGASVVELIGKLSIVSVELNGFAFCRAFSVMIGF